MRSAEISVFIGMLPEMKTTEPYSPMARANASAKPVSHAGYRYGRMTRRSTCHRLAPRLGRLLHFGAEVLDHRLERADDKRQADEHQRHHDAKRRKRHLD